MSTTTSKTKPTTEPTAAELSRLALAEARERFAIRQEEDRQAAEAAEELVARLAGGDDTPTGADLSLADYEMKRTALLLQAAESAVKRAQRALINDDTELADLVRDVLTGIYGMAVPIVVTGVPTDAKPNPDGQPVLFVVQPKPTTRAGGVLVGLVDVVFYRPSLFAPLDATKVDEVCRSLGFDVLAHQVSTAPEAGMYRDTLRLTVNRAFHAVPVLPAEPSDDAVREFARTVNGNLGAAVAGVASRAVFTGEPSPGRASSDLLTSRITSTAPGDDGTVRVTVTTSHKVTRNADLPESYAHRRLRDAVTALDGHVADGVGRVVSADTVTIDLPDPHRPDARRAPWTVTTRFVMAYRLG